mmetsp:Transcript_5008/g.10832  ORF Transcript_5008/g.10832 Transcript_5008/m.10832 type:complete len:290 (+) Transcript_5008:688-1557(+)
MGHLQLLACGTLVGLDHTVVADLTSTQVDGGILGCGVQQRLSSPPPNVLERGSGELGIRVALHCELASCCVKVKVGGELRLHEEARHDVGPLQARCLQGITHRELVAQGRKVLPDAGGSCVQTKLRGNKAPHSSSCCGLNGQGLAGQGCRSHCTEHNVLPLECSSQGGLVLNIGSHHLGSLGHKRCELGLVSALTGQNGDLVTSMLKQACSQMCSKQTCSPNNHDLGLCCHPCFGTGTCCSKRMQRACAKLLRVTCVVEYRSDAPETMPLWCCSAVLILVPPATQRCQR